MPPTTIHTTPQLDSFTQLEDHQSHTPATFYDEKPVLHYHATMITAVAAQDQVVKFPFYSSATNGAGQTEVESEEGQRVDLHEDVMVFISSE